MRNTGILKVIGGIFIVIGTCLGAGLLALPVGTSECGITYSLLLMFGCWLIMSLGAFYILEVTQWLPKGSNIISQARATLGKTGRGIAWLLYLVLCYSLLCAYISGGSDVFQMLLALIRINVTQVATALGFVVILGFVVFKGVRLLDLVNRWFMLIKFAAFFLLILLIVPYVKPENFVLGNSRYVLSALTIAITSFGFAIVVPTLYDYFDGNINKVRFILFIGTLIPFVFYVAWIFVIMGALSATGPNGLIHILKSREATSGLVKSLTVVINKTSITDLSRIFASVCMVTSFFGVSLSFTDFIADGFRIKKTFTGRWKVILITYIPPIIIIAVYPQIFIKALSYAGIICILLLVALPAVMVWQGRYAKKIAKGYKVFGGKVFLILAFSISALIVICRVLEGLNIIP